MPIQTRCPTCSAAVPANAAWCSLCHADLRPTPVEQAPSAVAPTAVLEPASTGRHAAGGATQAARPEVGGGRHAAGRRSAPRPARRSHEPAPAEAVLEGLDIPAEGELTPEQVDALAEQMLQRLAVTEKASTVLDPDDLPGGKWGLAAGLMAVIVIVLIAIGTVVGFIISR